MEATTTTRRFARLPLLLLALLVLDLALGAWLFQEQQEQQRRAVHEQLQAIATLKGKEIANWRQGLLDQAALVSESPFFAEGVQRYLADYRLDNAQSLLQRLRSMTTHYHYPGVILVDRGVRVTISFGQVASLQRDSTLAGLAERAMERREPLLGDLFQLPVLDQTVIAVAAPLFENGASDRPVLGAVILISDPQRFLFPLIESWPIASATAESLLLRDEGEDVLLLNAPRHAEHPPLTLRLPKSRGDLLATAAVAGKRGILVGRDYRDQEVVAYVQAIADSTWLLECKIDDREAFAEWRKQSALLVLAFSGIAALLIAFVVAMWQRNRQRHYQQLFRAEQLLRRNSERSAFVLNSISDAILVTDSHGRIELANPAACQLVAAGQAEPLGQAFDQLVTLTDEQSDQPLDSPLTAVLGGANGRFSHPTAVLRDRQNRRVPVAIEAAPLHDGQGRVNGVVIVLHDQSRARFLAKLTEKRLKISEYASSNNLSQLLVKMLDEICELVESPIGFFHFVNDEQQTLMLQEWSTRTQREFCRAEGRGHHYAMAEAGVWVDCVRQRQPVIHNDYASLPHKKGLPPGHAPVIRELVVPILQQDKVVAILGVGNKPSDYSDRDVETVSYLSEVIYHAIEAKRIEEVLRRSLQTSDDLVRAIPSGLFIYQHQEPDRLLLLSGNPEAERLTGKTLANLIGLDFDTIWPTARESGITAQFLEVVKSGKMLETEDLYYSDAQLTGAFRIRAFLLPGKRLGVAFENITGLKHAEAEKEKIQGQLQQAQKMESVGRLAGGVAHDFNNMLSVIIGNTELALEYAKKDSAMQRELLEIKTAALRSADLTRQLLAFARKQAVAPRVVNLNETIEGMLKMLRRLIGEDIQLVWLPQSALPPIFIDPSQIDQILANLCVNSRDAINGVGKVIIETQITSLSEEYCKDNPGTTPGDYVTLTFSDTGVGIAKDQLPHIFEPFFTTKRMGEGTGLGLAMIYGIVKQNGGYIKVYSEPGQGTTFRISLPQYQGEAATAQDEEELEIPPGRGELILLVEDETVIIEMNSRMLQRLGYRVIATISPAEAIALARQHREELRLLLTDIIMPEMNGYDLSKAITTDHPEIKVLFVSGYTANVISRQGVLPEGMNFLQKPFMKRELATKLHRILNG